MKLQRWLSFHLLCHGKQTRQGRWVLWSLTAKAKLIFIFSHAPLLSDITIVTHTPSMVGCGRQLSLDDVAVCNDGASQGASACHLLRLDFGLAYWCCCLVSDNGEKEIISRCQRVSDGGSNRRDEDEAEKPRWLTTFVWRRCDKGTHNCHHLCCLNHILLPGQAPGNRDTTRH